LILKNKHYNAHHQLVRWWYWLHEIPQTFWNAGATWLALDNTSIIWTIYGLIFKTTNTWSKLIFKTNVFLGMFGLFLKKIYWMTIQSFSSWFGTKIYLENKTLSKCLILFFQNLVIMHWMVAPCYNSYEMNFFQTLKIKFKTNPWKKIRKTPNDCPMFMLPNIGGKVVVSYSMHDIPNVGGKALSNHSIVFHELWKKNPKIL